MSFTSAELPNHFSGKIIIKSAVAEDDRLKLVLKFTSYDN